MTHMSKMQRLDQSTNMVINQVDVPLLLEEELDIVTSITDPTIPPVITSLEGTKPSDADSRRQDDLVARGACTSKTCTTSCGCPASLAAAAARLDPDEFTLHPTVEAAVLLSPPRRNDLGVTTDKESGISYSYSLIQGTSPNTWYSCCSTPGE